MTRRLWIAVRRVLISIIPFRRRALESLKATESALGSIFFNFTYEGLYNDYQTATNLTHDVYAAYNGSNGFLNNSPAYAL